MGIDIKVGVFGGNVVIVTGSQGDQTILRTPELNAAQVLHTARENLKRTKLPVLANS